MRGFDTDTIANVSQLPITVRIKSGISRVRKAMCLPGVGLGTIYGVHNHSLRNVLRGLVERVFRVTKNGALVPPPKPAANVFEDELSAFRGRLLRVLGSCRPWSMEQFIDSYKGAKQHLVRAAAEDVLRRPAVKSDAKLKTFVKAEKLNLSDKADPAPRVIQPRDVRYNCEVGPYLKAHEHNIYRAIADIWGGPTVMKGYNSVDTARHMRDMWNSIPQPCGIGLDASRFDQHVSRQALEWEHSIYNGMFHSKRLAELLRWQLVNRGKCHTPEGVVAYEVEGCRMSGDMNTSLGNCLIMTAMVWALCEKLGVPARLANNGDDCMLIVPRKWERVVRNQITSWFLKFGFTMKVEDTVYEFEQIEFCQTRPVFAAGRWVMCRNFAHVLDKDTFCLHPDSMPYKLWLRGVGTAGLSLSAGVPVLQVFYQGLMRLGGGVGELADGSGMSYMAKGLDPVSQPVTNEARVSFYRAFGMPPWVQEEYEAELAASFSRTDLGLIGSRYTYRNDTLAFGS